MIPKPTTVALYEYRLTSAKQAPDISLPLPCVSERNSSWHELNDVLKLIDDCLQKYSSILLEPWLEFDQPGNQKPGLFVKINGKSFSQYHINSSILIDLLKIQNPDFYSSKLYWPKLLDGLSFTHIGLFLQRKASKNGQLRFNIVGPSEQQWQWLCNNLPPHLLSNKLKTILHNEQIEYSVTFDYIIDSVGRIGIELYPANRLQKASLLNESCVTSLMNTIRRFVPCHNYHSIIANHFRLQGDSWKTGFSHFKLVPDGPQNSAWQLKCYLLHYR